MQSRYRSRRAEVAALREDLRAKGATVRQMAHVIRARFKVNSRIAYRYAHGLTQQQVADRWNDRWPATGAAPAITHKHVSYWENWPGPSGRSPSPEILNRLATIYRTAAAELLDGEDHTDPADRNTAALPTALTPSSSPGQGLAHDIVPSLDGLVTSTGPHPGDDDNGHQHLVAELIEWAYRMNRRDVLQWLSWGASAAAAPILDLIDDDQRDRVTAAIVTPSRVDGVVIEHVEAVLWRCMRQDDLLGPQAALDTVLAQRRLVREFLPCVPAAFRDRLLSLYANLSRFAGWLSFDLNNHAAAGTYYEAARAAAHEAHDTELGAFTLCNLSHLATWQHQPRIGIDHALAAIGWAQQTDDPQLQAYAWDVGARAFAMDQQDRAAMHAIDSAGAALSAPRRPSTTHAYFFNRGQLASTESLCHLTLGRPAQGIAIAEQSLVDIDRSFVRNLAIASLRLGVCRLRSPRPDVAAAASAIEDAARLASYNRSARIVGELRDVWRDLARWRDEPEVRSVRAHLAPYGIG